MLTGLLCVCVCVRMCVCIFFPNLEVLQADDCVHILSVTYRSVYILLSPAVTPHLYSGGGLACVLCHLSETQQPTSVWPAVHFHLEVTDGQWG